MQATFTRDQLVAEKRDCNGHGCDGSGDGSCQGQSGKLNCESAAECACAKPKPETLTAKCECAAAEIAAKTVVADCESRPCHDDGCGGSSRTSERPGILDRDGALAYENREMVERYVKRHGGTFEHAETLFAKTKAFLVLCAETSELLSPTKEVDEGWHFFILHTKDYADFCQRHLGRFIHHIPT